MSETAQLAFEDAKGGMNAFDPPHKIAKNQVARMVNCAIVDGYPTTRLGGRVVPLSGDSRDWVRQRNIQGSIFYNPAKGQGGIQFSASNSTLALAVAGRKFIVEFSGRRSLTVATPKDITAAFASGPQNHLVVLCQWEDYLIAADGEAKTFIYSPTTTTRLSRGYNTVDKLQSEIPNGAFVLFYAHSRGGAVVDSRKVIVGDSLHRENQSASLNILQTTEQVHFATGLYFLPPSSMGGINAAAILPLKNTQHGHADVLLHCEDGIFSIDINQYPRSSWDSLALVKHVKLQDGATGPYGVAVTDGDQMYRSRKGANSLRSAAAQPSIEGNPEKTISPEVDTWFSGDYPRWLRFASVSSWDRVFRAFYATAPIVQGSFRWHRGVVVRNTDPARTTAGEPTAWEGLWTLPPEMRGIIQTVTGIFDGQERMFAWTHGNDRVNRLVEFSPTLETDVLEDGTVRRIRCQCITRSIDVGKWWASREYIDAQLYLRGIRGLVNWGVWVRNAESPAWVPYRAGSVEVDPVDSTTLAQSEPRSVCIPLGKIPKDCQSDTKKPLNESRGLQFLVRWEGYCQFEGVKITHGEKDLTDTEFRKENFKLKFTNPTGHAYDDYEYAEYKYAIWREDEK